MTDHGNNGRIRTGNYYKGTLQEKIKEERNEKLSKGVLDNRFFSQPKKNLNCKFSNSLF